MAIGRSRKVLPVFLGSPGDLADERKAVREVVAELNRTLAREANWEIELLGWEDTLPGAKRPQELINEDVDACDLFVGMLWRRWGQPTGEYSSGFEEEFERVRERNAAKGEPEIWLFFKAVDPDQKADAGEQLQRVLQFRAERERQKDLLYRQFQDAEQFKGDFREMLLRYVLKLAFQDIRSTTQPAGSAPPVETSSANEPREDLQSNSPARRELRDCLSEISSELERLPSDELVQSSPISPVHTLRLFVFASSAVSWRHTREVLGTHDQNLVYKHGRGFHLAFEEATLLLRGILSDETDLMPGWAWVPTMTAEGLRYFAQADRETRIRKGALRLLADARVQFENGADRSAFFLTTFDDDDVDTIREALRYFSVAAEPNDLHVLESISDGRLRTDVQFALVALHLRFGNTTAAIDTLMASEAVAKETVVVVGEKAGLFSVDQLLVLLKHPDTGLRVTAAGELARRSQLSAEISRELLEDPSAELRRTALLALLALGESIDVRDIHETFKDTLFAFTYTRDLLVRAFELQTIDELQNRIDWFGSDTDEAYEALVRKAPAQFLPQVRSDLSSDFARIRQRSIDSLRERFGTAGADYLLTNIDQKIDQFIVPSLRQAAARLLADLGSAEDREFMATLLASDENDVRKESWRFFERLGTVADVSLLAEAAMKEKDVTLAQQGVATTLRLAPSAELASRFLKHGGEVAVATLHAAQRSPEIVSTDLLETLMKNVDASIRKAAVGALATRLSHQDLEKLLLRYISQATYFYNAVCWLDRILYAPPAVLPHYRGKLGI